MALRNILPESDSTLNKKSREITEFGSRLHILLDDMRETLIVANGLGLAAPQVGVLRRAALVVDTGVDSEDINDQIIELVNPVIINSSGEQNGTEGCLSVPGVYGIVTRPNSVEVRAKDRYGNDFTYSGEELLARALCHEVDHLDGLLFTKIAERFLTEEELEEMRNKREAGENETGENE